MDNSSGIEVFVKYYNYDMKDNNVIFSGVIKDPITVSEIKQIIKEFDDAYKLIPAPNRKVLVKVTKMTNSGTRLKCAYICITPPRTNLRGLTSISKTL